ncbi:MAG: hypothetical protein GY774_00245 [Planctomycetes bacterium]|nr:hypothetical protein [Planctomycetota bacterium]
MNRSELFKRAWKLKRQKPMLSFGECLKWSWSHTGCVFGKEEKAVETVEFKADEDFISGMVA